MLALAVLPLAWSAEKLWTAPGVVRDEAGKIDVASVAALASNRSRVPPLQIVGGTAVASPADYPWMTGWLEGGQQYCGGSLIHARWVLSAAHCYDGTVPRSSMGSLRYTAAGGAQIVDGARVFLHPSYNGATYDYDAAVVQLAADAPIGANVGTIGMASPADGDFAGVSATVTGWGETSSGGPVSAVLREVTYPVITNDYCGTMYNGITDRMLCAYQEGGGRDACQTDSGGPLVVKRAGGWLHVGIVSWGHGCAGDRAPGVYARTSQLRGWVCGTCNCC